MPWVKLSTGLEKKTFGAAQIWEMADTARIAFRLEGSKPLRRTSKQAN